MEQVQVTRHFATVFLLLAIANSIIAIPFAFLEKVQYVFIINAVTCWIVYFLKRNKGKIVLNDKGFFEDDKLFFHWEAVRSLDKITNSLIKIRLEDDSMKKINIFDLNIPSRNKIINYMKTKVGMIS